MVTFTTDASVIDEKLVAENNEPLRGEGPGTIAQPDCPPGETHRPVAAHGPEKAATGRITSLDEAGGGARGNDLREKQRSAVVRCDTHKNTYVVQTPWILNPTRSDRSL